MCHDLQGRLERESEYLSEIVTDGETWVHMCMYKYHPEMKQQSPQWKNPLSPPQKKQDKYAEIWRASSLLFSTFKESSLWIVRQARTVNHPDSIDTLWCLWKKCAAKLLENWNSGEWFLHSDNSSAHSPLSVCEFLVKNNVIIIPYPPCSPYSAQCDFFFYPKLKMSIGRRFNDVTMVWSELQETLAKFETVDIEMLHTVMCLLCSLYKVPRILWKENID